MKNAIRILSLVIVAVMLSVMLASCGGIDKGEYVFGDKNLTKTYDSFTFQGSKFTYDVYVQGAKQESESLAGKYKIKDGVLTLTWLDAEGAEHSRTHTITINEETGVFILDEVMPFTPTVAPK